MKKRLGFIVLVIVCLVFGLSSAMPTSANIKSMIGHPDSQYPIGLSGTYCSKCGCPLNGLDGEQSRLAEALGLTLCIDCWMDAFYGSDRSCPLPKIALLGEDGKVIPEQLPEGSGAGDMTKAVYDVDADSLVDKAENVDDGAGNASTAAQVKSAVTDTHTHSNKSTLDAIQEAFTSSLKTSYDWLVTNITEAWKNDVDAHTANMTNPHSVTKTQVGLGSVPNLDTTDAVNNQHTHVNKVALDAIQEALTTALKTTYDTCATAFTTAYKTTLDTFMASKGATNGIAPLDSNSKVPTVNLGGAGADSTKFLRGDQTWATPAGGGGESESVVVLSTNRANSTTTLADCTDLVFTADANSIYIIEGFIVWDSSAITVGIKISATATGSPTIQSGVFLTQAANGTPDSSGWNANDVVVTTSASSFTDNSYGQLNALLVTSGSSRTWQLRFAAETTGTITIQSGSVLRYRKVA